jgi:hypothetical protein
MSTTPSPHLDEDALALMRHVYEVASENLKRDGQLLSVAFFRVGPNAQMPPGMTAEGEDVKLPEAGSILMIPLHMADEQEKDFSAALIQFAADTLDADLIVHVSESWVVKATSPEIDIAIPPRMHPDRTEAIVLIAHKRGGRRWTVIATIERDKAGKPSIPLEMPEPEFTDKIEGRFAPE